MLSDDEEEIDYENDDSWYEDAMNSMDSPLMNHGIIYSDEDLADLSEENKQFVKLRNQILESGFGYLEIQNGDYIADVISRSATIHSYQCNFIIPFKRNNSYIVLFQLGGEDENVVNPIQIATLIHIGKHLGSYQFLEFYHLTEEIAEDQKLLNGIKINRELMYKEKPSLEFYASDKIEMNKLLAEKMNEKNPQVFEFINQWMIVELAEGSKFENYLELIGELESED